MSRQDAQTDRFETAPACPPERHGRRHCSVSHPRAPGRRFNGIAIDPTPVDIEYPTVDETVDEAAVRAMPQVGALTLFGRGAHYRVVAHESFALGHHEGCVIADGFFVQMFDLDLCAPTYMAVTAPDMLRVRVASAGNGHYVTAEGESVDFESPSTNIIIEPAGRPPAHAFFSGSNRAVHVYVHRHALRQLYAGGGGELPAVLRAFLDGDLARTIARPLPLVPALLRCLEELQGCALAGDSRRLFIRAKAMEILCHAFEVLGQEEGASAPSLSARGVMKAQRILEDSFASPPSLDVLAQQVGISRSGLCAGFRQILGQSVYDYIQELRMQHALTLLARRSTPITQIGYALGYSHPSSFSAAVLRRFGASPRELRRRGGSAAS